jgi:hypothetical protein
VQTKDAKQFSPEMALKLGRIIKEITNILIRVTTISCVRIPRGEDIIEAL